jgi:hypothetical protein
VAIAFFLGAAVMAMGGIVGPLFGVKAVQQSLDDIGKPPTEPWATMTSVKLVVHPGNPRPHASSTLPVYVHLNGRAVWL